MQREFTSGINSDGLKYLLEDFQEQISSTIEFQRKMIESKKNELDKREEDWNNNCNKLEKVF